MPTKTDFKFEIASYAAARGRFDLVDVPPLDYLMVDGHGDPNTAAAYQDALTALYPLAYALKFRSKAEHGRDYVVMPLEALWWSDDPSAFTTHRDKSRWNWTLMIMVAEWTTVGDLDAARATVAAKQPNAARSEVRLERLTEGLCVQTLHVGAYDDEGPTLQRMHEEFIPDHGLRMTGRHHEIYLSDARRTAPEKLRTILRQPVARID